MRIPSTGNKNPDSYLLFGAILPTLEQAKQLLVDEALLRSGNNVSEAARLLGISHQALNKWLKRRGDSSVLRFPRLAEINIQETGFSRFDTWIKKMRSVFLYLETVAATTETVLITGNGGIDKEVIARLIHQMSGRRGAFVMVNCADREGDEFELNLLGALGNSSEWARESLIEKAKGGTLYFEEIGYLGIYMQAKILRLLSTKTYYPLGARKFKTADVRLVLATERDLMEQVNENRFRRDLYCHISIREIHLPPLSETSSFGPTGT